MFGWLMKLFSSAPKEEKAPPKREPAPPQPKPRPPKVEEVKKPVGIPEVLPEEGRKFFFDILHDTSETDLQSLFKEERAFLSTLIRKVRQNEINIPVLPDVAIKIQKLLHRPNVELKEFAIIFRDDPALSAELLKVANSPFYGFVDHTTDLKQAILRVGFNQVRSIVVMVSFRSKVLQGGFFHDEVEWITGVSTITARTCQELSVSLGVSPVEAFTRGLLNHVEWFAILGMASEFAASNKGITAVRREILVEAIRRLGPEVMERIVSEWGLDQLGYESAQGGDGNANVEIRHKITRISEALVDTWAGASANFEVEGVPEPALRAAVQRALGR